MRDNFSMEILMICGDINGNTVFQNVFNERVILELAKDYHLTIITDSSYNKNRELCVNKNFGKNIRIFAYPDYSNLRRILKKYKEKFIEEKQRQNITEQKEDIHVIRKYNKTFRFMREMRINIFHPVYRGKHIWIKKASKFSTNAKFYLVISISHSPACHQVAYNLIKRHKIEFGKWVQIWQEPWYQKPRVAKETKLIDYYERKFIKAADVVFFSSEFLKEYFSNKYSSFIDKIDYIDLPADRNPSYKQLYDKKEFTIGYFGAYFSDVRNIMPFYKTICKLNLKSMIVGTSDFKLDSVGNIQVIHGSIPFHECVKLEKEMHCLVIIGNNFSDILPGKIYNYCGMEKPILFILDGTDKGIAFTRKKFEKYKNIYFSSNKINAIENTIKKIINDLDSGIRYEPVDDFSACTVVNTMLKKIEKC